MPVNIANMPKKKKYTRVKLAEIIIKILIATAVCEALVGDIVKLIYPWLFPRNPNYVHIRFGFP